MRRTIAQAREALGELADALNPESYARLNGEVVKASAHAITVANDHAFAQIDRFTSLREDAAGEADQLVTDYQRLIAEGEQGELSAEEYEARLLGLAQRKRELARRRTQLDGLVGVVEAIDADPEAWTDRTFYDRYPALRPEFTF